jgi:hypothetical protein
VGVDRKAENGQDRMRAPEGGRKQNHGNDDDNNRTEKYNDGGNVKGEEVRRGPEI